jgi:hypothetical protein
MIRRAAVVILALTLNQALLRAQDTVLTVNVPSADVYKGPSNVTPIIGHASRGAVLPVLRNLGSWIKVEWPAAPDGIGYVHVTMVTMGRVGPAGAAPPAAITSPRAQSAPAPPPVSPTTTPVVMHAMPRGPVNVTPAHHVFGVGGLAESMSSLGATARAWRSNRLGVQFGFTRDGAIQFEPAVVYALFDRVSDYVWIRPYVGSAMTFRREMPDNTMGFRVFGGSELTFASVPQLGLSADLGYRRLTTQSPLSASVALHWYIK